MQFSRLFFLDAEQNIPTFFSVLLILLAAAMLGIIAGIERKRRSAHALEWSLLAVLFLLMAYDEAFQIHEKLISLTRGLFRQPLPGIFYFAWVIPGFVIVLVILLVLMKFLLGLPARTRFRFGLSGCVYLGGVMGVEMIGGGYVALHGMKTPLYSLIVTFEEGLEMTGIILFIWTLVKFAGAAYGDVLVRLDGG